jgi:outer membrane murein-binding lipoprotein Lpp
MTLGQWINQTIRAAAANQLTGVLATQEPIPSNNALRPDVRPAPHEMSYPTPAPAHDFLVENLLSLTNRIERTEIRAEAAVVPLLKQVEQLSGQVAQVSDQVEQVRSQTVTSTAPVERAVQRLSERLEKIESSRNGDNERATFFGRGK